MRILGVDPGSHRMGWGIVELGRNLGRLQHVASGTLQAPAGELVARLLYLHRCMEELIQKHAPDEAAVEQVFFAQNVRSALVLGQARGAVLVALGRAGLTIQAYSASTIKQAVTGRGGADKQQVQQMVHMLLGQRLEKHQQGCDLDTSDALAAAICHAQLRTSLAANLRPQASP